MRMTSMKTRWITKRFTEGDANDIHENKNHKRRWSATWCHQHITIIEQSTVASDASILNSDTSLDDIHPQRMMKTLITLNKQIRTNETIHRWKVQTKKRHMFQSNTKIRYDSEIRLALDPVLLRGQRQLKVAQRGTRKLNIESSRHVSGVQKALFGIAAQRHGQYEGKLREIQEAMPRWQRWCISETARWQRWCISEMPTYHWRIEFIN